MTQIDQNRIKFYEFLNGNISVENFESWIYSNEQLEGILNKDHYIDLISFNFKSHDSLPYIKSIVHKFFDWKEYEKWRTIMLLQEIKNEKIEIVLATRKMRQLYLEQEEEIGRPLISIRLAIGYETELDTYPIESEYNQWNSDALEKQLESISWYKKNIIELASHELSELLNPELKTIDLGLIVNNKNLHETFADRLQFPDFYGNNWDSFWDAITGLVEMPKTLILKNWGTFSDTLPKDADMLKSIVQDYNKERTKNKIEIEAGSTVFHK